MPLEKGLMKVGEASGKLQGLMVKQMQLMS